MDVQLGNYRIIIYSRINTGTTLEDLCLYLIRINMCLSEHGMTTNRTLSKTCVFYAMKWKICLDYTTYFLSVTKKIHYGIFQ